MKRDSHSILTLKFVLVAFIVMVTSSDASRTQLTKNPIKVQINQKFKLYKAIWGTYKLSKESIQITQNKKKRLFKNQTDHTFLTFKKKQLLLVRPLNKSHSKTHIKVAKFPIKNYIRRSKLREKPILLSVNKGKMHILDYYHQFFKNKINKDLFLTHQSVKINKYTCDYQNSRQINCEIEMIFYTPHKI